EGTGALYLELEQLKARLEREGLFEPSRKRPLPAFPQVIGLVTSPTGAVLHDICTILQRRYPLVELVLAPTPVQGEEAAPGIVAAIQALNRQRAMDLILLARGGGSLEELWPFNEEVVARAIYASHAPVVSAVGHETDVTIADLVADLRAPTPSAAAELVVPDGAALRQEVLAFQERGQRAIQDWLAAQRQAVDWLAQRLQGRAPNVATARLRVDGLLHAAFQAVGGRLALLHERLSGMELRLQALSPQHILSRGYAVVQRQPQGEVVSRTAQVTSGDELKVTVSDGSFPARVGKGVPPKQRRRKQQVYAGKPLF
ncbi:MAG: exodeoxyribonuclease VII large subunit, partial [Dehalococcoidia bacterium]